MSRSALKARNRSSRVERSVQSLTDDLETRAEHVDKRFKQIAAQLDMEGKSIFQMFVCFVLL